MRHAATIAFITERADDLFEERRKSLSGYQNLNVQQSR